MLVIAVVGHPSSGKDTVAEYLHTKGFAYISSSDRIRQDMRAVGIETTRENMNTFSIEMRRQRGFGYPADEIAREVSNNSIISGFRNTAEIKLFKDTFGDRFILIALDVPQSIRFERAKERGRIGDDVSLEQFRHIEEKERAGSNFHEVGRVIAMADYTIQNDGAKENLFVKIEEILRKHLPD
ncbi:AAA family ATPase [Candidatus Wolfebacteria bacterium]|nr:AAA family ATPase [Candidatus Wolfebacteria bacterium]